LGLENTFYGNEGLNIINSDELARGYQDEIAADGSIGQDGIPDDFTYLNLDIFQSTGAIFSNTQDLASFSQALFGGELLEPQSLQEMLDFVRPVPEAPDFGWGLGISENESPWGSYIGRGGDHPGYQAGFNYFPELDATIAIATNRQYELEDPRQESQSIIRASFLNYLGLSSDSAFNGTNGKDNLNGTQADDLINGLEGNDTLLGKDGQDALDGGQGNDLLTGDKGDDFLFGKENDDLLDGGEDSDLLNGGKGNDELRGGTGNDTLLGSQGDDFLDGGEDDDLLNGGAGNDEVRDKQGNNSLYGNEGDDLLFAGMGDDILHGDEGSDRAIAGSGDDQLFGDKGNDYLNGDKGDDNLLGGNGNDTLVGFFGSDTLTDRRSLRTKVFKTFPVHDIIPLLTSVRVKTISLLISRKNKGFSLSGIQVNYWL
jgi:Ca2+-binding RTX toxin-like protein